MFAFWWFYLWVNCAVSQPANIVLDFRRKWVVVVDSFWGKNRRVPPFADFGVAVGVENFAQRANISMSRVCCKHTMNSSSSATGNIGTPISGILTRIFHRQIVAQTSKSAVSRPARRDKPADATPHPTPRRLGSRRHGRLGSLRYLCFARLH